MPPLCCGGPDQREGCQGTLGDYCQAPQLLSCQCRGNPQGTLCCLCKGWDSWARSCIMLSRSAGLGSPNGQDGLNYWCCLLIPPLIALRSEASVVTRCCSCCAPIQQHNPLDAQAIYGGELGTGGKNREHDSRGRIWPMVCSSLAYGDSPKLVIVLRWYIFQKLPTPPPTPLHVPSTISSFC